MALSRQQRLKILEQQIALGWRGLRFHEALEADFRRQYREWSIPFRRALILLASFLVAISPLLDTFLLKPPLAFAEPVHQVQLGVMLPALLVAALSAHRPALRRYSDITSLLAVTCVVGGLLFQRHLGAQTDVWVPTELISATLAGGYVMGGLRFWRTTAVAAASFLAMASNEIHSYGNTAVTQYILFGVMTQFMIAGLAGYLQEHFARGAWLRNELLSILASQDALTGLLNFRAFDQRYQQLLSFAARNRKPILVVMLDLDCFKQYNDTYGHPAGNECLKRVTEYLSLQFRRDSDIKARLGGEEFGIVACAIERAEAQRRVEALRAGIADLGIPHARSTVPDKVVTVSIGAHWFIPPAQAAEDDAVQAADHCLYAAKEAGRNRVVFSDEAAAAGQHEVMPAGIVPAIERQTGRC